MAIQFQCPNCGVIRTANPRLLGREIQCPQCAEKIRLPSHEELEQAQSAKRERSEAMRREREFQRTLSRALSQSAIDAGRRGDTRDERRRMADEEKALAAANVQFTRPSPPPNDDMDMTPMVDMTFLLLIFFMVTASFAVQKSIEQPAQKDQDPSTMAVERPLESDTDIVTVQVDEFNAYNVLTSDWDRIAGNKQDLIIALSEAHEGDSSGNQPTKLIVQAHEDCFHEAVIAALDAGREARFESFEVDTVEQFD